MCFFSKTNLFIFEHLVYNVYATIWIELKLFLLNTLDRQIPLMYRPWKSGERSKTLSILYNVPPHLTHLLDKLRDAVLEQNSTRCRYFSNDFWLLTFFILQPVLRFLLDRGTISVIYWVYIWLNICPNCYILSSIIHFNYGPPQLWSSTTLSCKSTFKWIGPFYNVIILWWSIAGNKKQIAVSPECTEPFR